nr:tRNA-dihydrouridine(16/17) synthase [NAD(P)(+)]-like isoform X3 [Pan troglodytes]
MKPQIRTWGLGSAGPQRPRSTRGPGLCALQRGPISTCLVSSELSPGDDAKAAGLRVLEPHPARGPPRRGPHGGPERAGVEAAEPAPRGTALLHAHAACPGLCPRRQLPEGEPVLRGVPRGPAPHRAGHYGAFLQDEWDLLQRMILLAHEKLSVPVTCKIRVFPEIDKTVRYAQMLEKAGCQLLTVHGRTKEQKGPLSGAASWEHIKAVRKAVAIPVFANGNIQCLQDVERCLRDTGVQGVMSAEGNLHNPALFEGRSPAVWELAEEYLDIVREHPCPLSYVRAHLFKLWHHTLQVHQELREELAKVKTLEGIAAVSQELKLRCQEEISRQEGAKPTGDLPFHWICQPYIRPGPREGSKEKAGARSKRALEEEECGTEVLSKNKQKKQLRNPHKTFDPSLKPKYAKCDQCGNPKRLPQWGCSPAGQTGPGSGAGHRLPRFPVPRATDVCSACAAAAARSEPPKRLQTAQVTDCFLKPNWRSLWPGKRPSLSCRSLSQQHLEHQVASPKSWAVPWPEGPEPPPPGLLLEPGHVLLKKIPFTQGISCYLMWKDTPMSPFGPLWGPGNAAVGSRPQAGPALSSARVCKSEQ